MTSKKGISRRHFLRTIGAGGAVLAAAAGNALPLYGKDETAVQAQFSVRDGRLASAKKIRERAIELALNHDIPIHTNNGEERDYPHVATYTKGLRHNDLGEVTEDSWNTFAAAIVSGKFEDFEKIPMNERRLKNPLSGLSYELEGTDSTLFLLKPAPRIDGVENSAEMAELYWEALCRDVNFTDYQDSKIVQSACEDLSRFSAFHGFRINGAVTPACLFRGNAAGDLVGPYLSQFFLWNVPLGIPFDRGQTTALRVNQLNHTAVPASDFLTTYESWLHCNNGGFTREDPKYDDEPRYIRNGRDLASAVHIDLTWQFGLNAAFILLNQKIPFDPANPYIKSKSMEGFGTFAYPHLMGLIAEASVRACRAVWFQKWWVHRRQRPETFGGRIHNHLAGAAKYPMINAEILNSPVLDRTFKSNQAANSDGKGTHLLPQVYPEGSQLHPAYASGHAAMIGAAVTVLKAWFDETVPVTAPVIPDSLGVALVPYTGEGKYSMTVGAELDKLASNIAIGRNWAGIHWRTDAIQGMALGEEVAIRLLNEQSIAYNEPVTFSLTKFNGTKVSVGRQSTDLK